MKDFVEVLWIVWILDEDFMSIRVKQANFVVNFEELHGVVRRLIAGLKIVEWKIACL
jgi:hypothetical protein